MNINDVDEVIQIMTETVKALPVVVKITKASKAGEGVTLDAEEVAALTRFHEITAEILREVAELD